jgi:hypothetical protein
LVNLMIPQIKLIVGPYLLTPAPMEADCKEATDLIVMHARDMRIACRVRRPGYRERYPNQFTIRCHRASGAPTKLEKIVNGFGDWFFYAHATEENTISEWLLIDLASFRAALARRASLRCGKCPNGDGTSLAWFDVTSFPPRPPILIAENVEF